MPVQSINVLSLYGFLSIERFASYPSVQRRATACFYFIKEKKRHEQRRCEPKDRYEEEVNHRDRLVSRRVLGIEFKNKNDIDAWRDHLSHKPNAWYISMAEANFTTSLEIQR